MPASEARIAAARANGAKSQGPVTAEGKAVSRRNALKHGMAGAGVVLPPDEAAEVDRRSAAMLDEMRPGSEMGRFLTRRLAALTVRVERCSDHERALNEHHAAHAEEAFDEARLVEADFALARIGEAPATFARRLRSMPEGVDRLIAGLLALRDELDAGRWDRASSEGLAHLTGSGWADPSTARVRALTLALVDDDGGDPARVGAARAALGGLIDSEVEGLLAHRESLDFEAIEGERASAAGRSSFDPSREAALARRYEAAAERGVFRALGEFRRVEAEAAAVAAEVSATEVLGPGAVGETLGSFGAGAVVTVPAPRPASAGCPGGQGHPHPTAFSGGERPRMVGAGGRG